MFKVRRLPDKFDFRQEPFYIPHPAINDKRKTGPSRGFFIL